MVPVDGRPLPGLTAQENVEARRIAHAVGGRTQTRCFYNIVSGKLLFCYDAEPHGGPLLIAFKNKDGTTKRHTELIDDYVSYINYGKMPRRAKDKMLDDQEMSRKNDETEARGRFSEENRKDFIDYAEFRQRKRRGTDKVFA